MRKIRIHLSQPFEEILAAVLSLPGAQDCFDHDANVELKQVLRELYEAANGRQVETALGFVPIAPAIAPFIKEAPFEVETQLDFFVEAMSRVITCPSNLAEVAGGSETIAAGVPEFVAIRSEVTVAAEGIRSHFSRQRNDGQVPAGEVRHG